MMKDHGMIDVVYTWVDDKFPGYTEQLAQYATLPQDRNPNRTRDNLDLLKYAMRSLDAAASFVRHVYLVSCRPQIPPWLNVSAPGLTVIHHDSFMDPALLPTFNSFTIQSCLHLIPNLSERFLHVEDDLLFGQPIALSDFLDPDGRMKVFRGIGHTAKPDMRDRADISPWNASLAYTNHILNTAFRKERRARFVHAPLLVERQSWEEMIAFWNEDFSRTRCSRFRAMYNVVPDYLYPYFLGYTGRARLLSYRETYGTCFYGPLENSLLLASYVSANIRLRKPKFIALNDGFGEVPDARVEAVTRALLEKTWPHKSRFEL
jgi:hypothetical protein